MRSVLFFRKRKMSGFGHRVYKNYDPRAKVIRKLAEEVFSIVGRDPLIEVSYAEFLYSRSPVYDDCMYVTFIQLVKYLVNVSHCNQHPRKRFCQAL